MVPICCRVRYKNPPLKLVSCLSCLQTRPGQNPSTCFSHKSHGLQIIPSGYHRFVRRACHETSLSIYPQVTTPQAYRLMHKAERDGSPPIRALFTYTSRKEEFREIVGQRRRREQAP